MCKSSSLLADKYCNMASLPLWYMIPTFDLYRKISIAGRVKCMPITFVCHRHTGMSLSRLLGPDTKEETGHSASLKFSGQVMLGRVLSAHMPVGSHA